MERTRSIAIDVARGLAVVMMIQTHAYDGWVREAARAEAGFRFTRFLGVLPLPTFLVLAGVGMVLRIEAGRRRDEPAASIRGALVRRGLEVTAAGFALNLALGWIDGGRTLETFLRVDVLHAIGLSIAIAAAIVCRGSIPRARIVGTGLASFVVLAATVIPLTRLGRVTSGPTRFLVGLLVEVPGVTKMPVVPLAAFLGVGLVLGVVLTGRPAPSRSAHLRLAFVAVPLALGAVLVEERMVSAIPGTFDRTHPAIVANLVELSARAVALVALVLALDPPASSPIARWLALLGRHSLLGYAVHLPFAYGRIPKAISRDLGMPEATALLALLVLGTTLVVALADRREHALSTRGRQA